MQQGEGEEEEEGEGERAERGEKKKSFESSGKRILRLKSGYNVSVCSSQTRFLAITCNYQILVYYFIIISYNNTKR